MSGGFVRCDVYQFSLCFVDIRPTGFSGLWFDSKIGAYVKDAASRTWCWRKLCTMAEQDDVSE